MGAGAPPRARSLMIAPPEVEGLAFERTVRVYADVVYTRVKMACERYAGVASTLLWATC